MNHVNLKGKPFKPEETDDGIRGVGQLELVAPNGSVVGKLLMGLELGKPGIEDKLSIVVGPVKPELDAVDMAKELTLHGPVVGRFLELCGRAYLMYSSRGVHEGEDTDEDLVEEENKDERP